MLSEKSAIAYFLKPPVSMPPNSFVQNTTGDCDTVNYPVDTSWSAISYEYSGDGGFLNGTNDYQDLQKANYFDLSATAYTHILNTYVGFNYANSSEAANLSKNVLFRVYEDNAGIPGTLLGTAELALSEIKADIDSGFLTNVVFTTPIELPVTKKIYVSVDISNFTWPTDTVVATGTRDDNFSLPTLNWDEADPGQAWEQWQDTASSWHSYVDAYLPFDGDPNDTFNITFWIFPVVSTDATGCVSLPVKLLSFNAERRNNDVTLNWQIAEERGMKGYEIERADNNSSFRTVATVPALNNAKNQSYSFIDRNVFTTSSAVQYRLKQVDGDGTVDYSRVISVKSTSSISDITFANPFNGALKMQLNLATTQPVSINLYDMHGKLVASEKQKIYNAASNTIIMSSTANLQSGVYVLKVIAGTEQAVYKVVKQ